MNATLTVRHPCRTVRHACAVSNPRQCAMCGISQHSLRHAREGKTVFKKYQNVSHVARDPAHASMQHWRGFDTAQPTRTDTRYAARARSRARAPGFLVFLLEKRELVGLKSRSGAEVAHA